MKLSEVAELLQAKVSGDLNHEINNAAKIENASENDIVFLSNPAYEKYFHSTKAGAVIISEKFYSTISSNGGGEKNLLIVDNPYISFLKILETLYPKANLQQKGISPSATVSESARLGDDVSIGSGCFVGENCSIGKSVIIMNNSVILKNSVIGDNVLIYPNVTVYQDCNIGNNVIIHAGTVIGSDGFGQAKSKDGTYKKIPQTGNVVIEDDVEIGSNCSIDRATLGSTIISKGVKLDNQIQVAHNVYIGENTVIAAQTGIAGSARIGKNCMIGGQVGIVGHIEICDGTIITASVGVSKSITEPGIYSGYRAQPIKKELRKEALIRNLETIIKDLKKK